MDIKQKLKGLVHKGTVTLETATFDDCPVLAEMNRQLIDEGRQSNTMTSAELSERMREKFQSRRIQRKIQYSQSE